MQKTNTRAQAPFLLRSGIWLLATLLTFLLIWLLGFVLSDIDDLKGPDFSIVSQTYVSPALAERTTALEAQIRQIDLQVGRQREIQQTLQRSMDNARETMQQMMNLHRLSLEQKVTPNEPEREALATSQQRFLDAQDQFEQANAAIATSNQQKFDLNQELNAARAQAEEQLRPARQEYERLIRRHRVNIASLKLAFIVPLFLLASWLVYRFRDSSYRPALLALLAATFWKLGLVMFDHFPREFFKYIAILAGIGIVLAFLVWMLRRSLHPGRAIQLKRFREAYATHHCPICAYPIARGALKFAIWTRKGPQIQVPSATPPGTMEEARYACPSCGTQLFEKCEQCGDARHSLLPYCEHCGHGKSVPELEHEAAA